jgi:hypothetical protein
VCAIIIISNFDVLYTRWIKLGKLDAWLYNNDADLAHFMGVDNIGHLFDFLVREKKYEWGD